MEKANVQLTNLYFYQKVSGILPFFLKFCDLVFGPLIRVTCRKSVQYMKLSQKTKNGLNSHFLVLFVGKDLKMIRIRGTPGKET